MSCQQCHTGRVPDPAWANASLPPPLPVDLAHPGRERLRSCDFQNAPPCGPCDGLGGPRTGDRTDESTPAGWQCILRISALRLRISEQSLQNMMKSVCSVFVFVNFVAFIKLCLENRSEKTKIARPKGKQVSNFRIIFRTDSDFDWIPYFQVSGLR